MIAIKVRVRGLSEFIAKNEKVIKAIEAGDVTTEVEKKIVRRAKYRGPRKKGKLVRSIHSKRTSKHSFKIICDAENEAGEPYPALLEYGTRYIPVGTEASPIKYKASSGKTAFRPYIAWAKWRTLQELQKIFKDKILKFYK